MRKIATALALAAGVTMTAGAIATPALADVDFRFGININPPGYYHSPHYYGYRPYYDPYYGPYYHRHYY